MTFATPMLVTGTPDRPEVTSLRRISLRRDAQADTPALFKEDWLQTIIDRSPEVLPIDEFYPDATRLCSLGREVPVPLSEAGVGYIDNLLVTDDGHLVLVETKLARNPEAIRNVVAQVLQYAMAVGNLGLLQLEQACREAAVQGRKLNDGETIAVRMRETGSSTGSEEDIADDFEDRFANLRQRGEILVLVVADGIQASAERLIKWIGSKFRETSPLKFGLVELRVFDSPSGGKIVVPKTLLLTREISRHTIVVEVHDESSAPVKVTVKDLEPNRPPTTRSVGKADTPLTKETFMMRARSLLTGEQFATIEMIVSGLEQLGLATKGTPTTWQYGVKEGSAFLGLVALGDQYIWCQIPARLRALLGGERFVECKRLLNSVAGFYRPEDVEDPDKVNALTPKDDAVVGKEQDFVKVIGTIADLARARINEQS